MLPLLPSMAPAPVLQHHHTRLDLPLWIFTWKISPAYVLPSALNHLKRKKDVWVGMLRPRLTLTEVGSPTNRLLCKRFPSPFFHSRKCAMQTTFSILSFWKQPIGLYTRKMFLFSKQWVFWTFQCFYSKNPETKMKAVSARQDVYLHCESFLNIQVSLLEGSGKSATV